MDDEQRYTYASEVAEAGALIQRFFGSPHSIIEAAEDFVVAHSLHPHAVGAFIVGVNYGREEAGLDDLNRELATPNTVSVGVKHRAKRFPSRDEDIARVERGARA